MKVIKKNPQKKEEEDALKETRSIDNESRTLYLEKVKKDEHFQKYIVEEILQKNLSRLSDLNNLPNANFNNLEEVGKLVLQQKMARAVLEKILGDILN